MRPHEKLDVWKKAIEFVVAVYKATEDFPKDERLVLFRNCEEPRSLSQQTSRKAQAASHTKSLRIFCRTHKVLRAR